MVGVGGLLHIEKLSQSASNSTLFSFHKSLECFSDTGQQSAQDGAPREKGSQQSEPHSCPVYFQESSARMQDREG